MPCLFASPPSDRSTRGRGFGQGSLARAVLRPGGCGLKIRVLLAIACCLAAAPGSPAQSTEINALGSSDFQKRQAATRALWADPKKNQQAVESAAELRDPEIGRRAQWILEQWQFGLGPQTPAADARLIRRAVNSQPPDVATLLARGYFDIVLGLIEEGRVSSYELAGDLYRLFSAAPKQDLSATQREALLELLTRAIDHPELAQLRAQLLLFQGADPSAITTPPDSTRNWPVPRIAQYRAEAFWLLQQHDEAIDSAVSAGAAEIAEELRLRDGRWSELLEALPSGGTSDELQRQSQRLLFASLAEEPAEANAALEALRAAMPPPRPTDPDELESRRWWGVESLLATGHVDEATALLQVNSPQEVAELYRFQWRLKEALNVYGIQSIDRDVPEVVDRALRAVRERRQSADARFQQALDAAQLAYRAGHLGAARSAYRRLATAEGDGSRRAQEVIETLVDVGRSDWALELAQELPAARDAQHEQLAMWLSPADRSLGLILWDAVSQLHGDRTPDERLAIVNDLLSERQPQSWESWEILDAIANYLRPNLRSTEGQDQAEIVQNYLSTASLLRRLRRPDLAIVFLDPIAGSEQAWRMKAEMAIDGGRWRDAAQALERARQLSPEQLELAAMLAVARQRSGAALEGQARLQQMVRAPLPARTRLQIAKALRQVNAPTSAQEQIAWTLRTASTQAAFFWLAAAQQAYLLEEHDPAGAADWWERYIAWVVVSDQKLSRPAFYVQLQFEVHRLRGLAAARSGDSSTARRELLTALSMMPGNLDLGENMIAELDQRGMRELADELFDKIFMHLVEHTRQFPLDPSTWNNAAWVAARSNRRLEEGREMARRAVLLEPDSTSYRDTLAEVLYRLNEVDAATAIERQAMLDAPAEWHLHEQLARFADQALAPGTP